MKTYNRAIREYIVCDHPTQFKVKCFPAQPPYQTNGKQIIHVQNVNYFQNFMHPTMYVNIQTIKLLWLILILQLLMKTRGMTLQMLIRLKNLSSPFN